MGAKVNFLAEISRKVLHSASAGIALVYLLLDQSVMRWLIVPFVIFAIVVEVLRHRAGFRHVFAGLVGFMVRDGEWARITGATYVLVGAMLTIWAFPKRVAVIALLITSLADSAASLVGLWLGRGEFFGKSMAGSLAFFFTAFIITAVGLPESLGVAFTAALVATVAEALPAARLGRFELNDNLLIPVLTGTSITLMQHWL